MPAIGLDISDSSFKYVSFQRRQNGFRLKDFGTGEIPAGTITNGVIQNMPQLSQTLSACFAAMPYRYAALSLPEEKAFMRTIQLPALEQEEIESTVALQLEEHIPLGAENIAFACHALPRETDDETRDILVAAFPRDLLLQYREALLAAHMTPLIMEIESQAIARAVIPETEEHERVLVIDIGLTRTSFLFARNGFAQHTATIPLGGKTMNQLIARSLNITEPEAEQFKKEEGHHILEILSPLFGTLQDEIRRQMAFWQASAVGRDSSGKKEISRVYLCGGDANLSHLSRYLSFELNIPVETGNVWVNVPREQSYVPEIEFRQSLGYATAVGLALGFTRESL